MGIMNNIPTHMLRVYAHRSPARDILKTFRKRATHEGTFDRLEGSRCFDCCYRAQGRAMAVDDGGDEFTVLTDCF